MKKSAIVLVVTIVLSMVVSACGSTQECPAYADANVNTQIVINA